MRIGRRQALVGGALAIGACGKARGRGFDDYDAGAGAGDAGPSIFELREAGRTVECDAAALTFDADTRDHAFPAASVLYSWTTPEQIAELRAGRVLFTRTERPGLGPGYAMDLFAKLAGDTDDQARIAALLSGATFAKARYAWTAAWPTRMGWPGETYGNQLLRIELRPEAYTVAYSVRGFRAVDAANRGVPLADVLAAPERIGAIYFVKDAIHGPCGVDAGADSFGEPPWWGSFTGCPVGVGYREYIVGNEAMVAEWSHATEATRAEIERGRGLLTSFLTRFVPGDQADPAWNARVIDHWFHRVQCSEVDAYMDALAIPSPAYEPIGGNIGAIIDVLGSDLFTPDPFVVRPGRDGG